MKFEVIGESDPFLLVSLKKGEKIFCESNAMVTMDGTLELKSQTQGGILSSIARKFANGESFFNQSISATFGDGDTLLSAETIGGIKVLDVGGKNQYYLTDGAFVASSDSVDLVVKTQSIGNALFGGTGGFFITKTSGNGFLAVTGLGCVMELNIEDGNSMIVDNGHIVAWDQSLNYEITASTNKSAGFLSNMVNSLTSGEGLVTKFSGNGKIYVCSRNKVGFINWLRINTGRTN